MFYSSVEDTFQIDRRTGKIKVVGQIDREFVEEFRVMIVVEDLNALNLNDNEEEKFVRKRKRRQPSRQITSIPIKIIVDDVNDNAPTFRKRFYTSSVAENSELGTIITTIIADDLDKNRTVTYR